MPSESLTKILTQVRACTLCADTLPLGPRPVLQAGRMARILVVGQAPGSRVHATGVPFNDPSGERLRTWMGIDKDVFYDPERIALLPMAFCYPGRGKSGDLPPPKLCAASWRNRLLRALPHVELTLVLGQYAQAWHLPGEEGSLADIVKNWRAHAPACIPMPHPSPRNNLWLRRNPWFEAEVVPWVQARIVALLAEAPATRRII
jgi:uracil-DNA glycosylase